MVIETINQLEFVGCNIESKEVVKAIFNASKAVSNDKIHFPFVHHLGRFEVDDFKPFKSRFGIKRPHIEVGIEFVQKVGLCHSQCG